MSGSDPVSRLDARYRPLADRMIDGLRSDERVRALLFTGSLGAGEADAHSDLDLTAIVRDDEACDAVAATLLDLVGAAVHHAFLPTGNADRVFTAITAEWLRVDVLVTPAATITTYPLAPFAVVFDRDGIEPRLPVGEPPQPDIERLTVAFLRMLGLLDVVAARGEYVVAAQGVPALRDLLITLLRAEQGLRTAAGVKHLSRDLDADRYAVLTRLPPIAYDASAIEAQLATARVFLPRARRLLGDHWPARFATATGEHLARTLGVHLPELGTPDATVD